MNGNEWFTEAFADVPVMAILRGYGPDRTVEIAQAAWDLGVRALEVPIQTEQDLITLEAAVRAGAERGLPVGAGTVISVEQVTAARVRGAVFTVAPGLDPVIAAASAEAGMAHLPGVATATEIQRAMALGLSWFKAFPAAELGSSWFRAMRGPFPNARFVATGGMGAGNAAEFLDAGADVLSLGSALADPATLPAIAELITARRG